LSISKFKTLIVIKILIVSALRF